MLAHILLQAIPVSSGKFAANPWLIASGEGLREGLPTPPLPREPAQPLRLKV